MIRLRRLFSAGLLKTFYARNQRIQLPLSPSRRLYSSSGHEHESIVWTLLFGEDIEQIKKYQTRWDQLNQLFSPIIRYFFRSKNIERTAAHFQQTGPKGELSPHTLHTTHSSIQQVLKALEQEALPLNEPEKQKFYQETTKDVLKEYGKNLTKVPAFYQNKWSEISMAYELKKAGTAGRFSIQLPIIILGTLLAILWEQFILERRRENKEKFRFLQKKILSAQEKNREIQFLLQKIRDHSFTYLSLTALDKRLDDANLPNQIYQQEKQSRMLLDALKEIEPSYFGGKVLYSEIEKEKKKVKTILDVIDHELLIQKAIAHWGFQEYDEAIQLLLSVMDTEKPHTKMAFLEVHSEMDSLLGVLYFIKNNHALAQTYIIKAIEKNPDNKRAINNLGYLYKENEYYQEAEKIFKKVIFDNPTFALTRANLADLYNKQGNYVKALSEIDKAIEISKKHETVIFLLEKLGILIDYLRLQTPCQPNECIRNADELAKNCMSAIDESFTQKGHHEKENYGRKDKYHALKALYYHLNNDSENAHAELAKLSNATTFLAKLAKIHLLKQAAPDEVETLVVELLSYFPALSISHQKIRQELCLLLSEEEIKIIEQKILKTQPNEALKLIALEDILPSQPSSIPTVVNLNEKPYDITLC